MQGMQFDSWIRKFLGEGNGVPLQCSCLRNPMDRGAWGATGHGVAKTQKRLPSVQFSSVAQSCQTLCDPMDCSMPGLPVHHQFPEFAQTHVHRVSDATQSSHPLSIPFSCLQSFPASGSFPMSQLFASGGQSTGVSASTSVLPKNIQD